VVKVTFSGVIALRRIVTECPLGENDKCVSNDVVEKVPVGPDVVPSASAATKRTKYFVPGFS
jgi:hypothetical protein